MARKKSYAEKIATAPAPKTVVLDKPFGGVPAGARLYISSPAELRGIVADVPAGEVRAVPQIRQSLAAAREANATCPVTTGIFLRIVAEDALEKIAAGVPATEVTPFWRVIDPASDLAKKLTCGPAFIQQRRAEESR